MWYVYIDYTLEENPRPFYVGKGNANRIENYNRNKHHTNIKTKYGIRREIVYQSLDEDDAFLTEIILIKEHNTFVHDTSYTFGANYTRGGEGSTGFKYKFTDEQLQNLIDAVTNSWKNPISRQNHLNSLHRPETLEMISEAAKRSQRKNWDNPTYRENQLISIKIAQSKPETKAKRSASVKIAQTLLWSNDEYRERMTNIQREVWKDEDLLQKCSDKQKETWKDDEERRQNYSKRMQENNPAAYKVLQFDLMGNVIVEYPSMAATRKALNLSNKEIRRILYHENEYNGYVWKLKHLCQS